LLTRMTTLCGFMITRISSFLFLLTIVLLPTVAFGNGDFVKLVGIPNISPSSLSTEDYVRALYKLAIGVGAMLAVLKLIGAGAKYITSDIITSKESAKKDIKNSILGLLVILSAVLVLQTINPALKNLSFLANAPKADIYLKRQTPRISGDIGDAVEKYNCPDGKVLRKNVNNRVTCVDKENSRTPITVTDPDQEFQFESLVLDDKLWLYARERNPDLNKYNIEQIVGSAFLPYINNNEDVDIEAIVATKLRPACQKQTKGSYKLLYATSNSVGTNPDGRYYFCIKD